LLIFDVSLKTGVRAKQAHIKNQQSSIGNQSGSEKRDSFATIFGLQGL
jgi:hypothetical protein